MCSTGGIGSELRCTTLYALIHQARSPVIRALGIVSTASPRSYLVTEKEALEISGLRGELSVKVSIN